MFFQHFDLLLKECALSPEHLPALFHIKGTILNTFIGLCHSRILYGQIDQEKVASCAMNHKHTSYKLDFILLKHTRYMQEIKQDKNLKLTTVDPQKKQKKIL